MVLLADSDSSVEIKFPTNRDAVCDNNPYYACATILDKTFFLVFF